VKSFGYKYDSFSTSNSTLKLICHGGLPTYMPFILEVCEILYLNEDAKPPKKMKKSYETSQKFQNTWTVKFLLAKMLQGNDREG
jgi:hypothetical protein